MSAVLSARVSDEFMRAVDGYAAAYGLKRCDVLWVALMQLDDNIQRAGIGRRDRRYDKKSDGRVIRRYTDRPKLRYENDPLLQKLIRTHHGG